MSEPDVQVAGTPQLWSMPASNDPNLPAPALLAALQKHSRRSNRPDRHRHLPRAEIRGRNLQRERDEIASRSCSSF